MTKVSNLETEMDDDMKEIALQDWVSLLFSVNITWMCIKDSAMLNNNFVQFVFTEKKLPASDGRFDHRCKIETCRSYRGIY